VIRPARRADPLLFLLPTFAVLFAFFFLPLGMLAKQSFQAWDLLGEPRWVGLDNYRAIARGDLFGSILRTMGFSVVVVLGSGGLGLGLALLCNRAGAFAAFVRGSVFSAYVVSHVAVALLWMWLLDGDVGIVSSIVRGLGLRPRAWLADESTALWALAGVSIWKTTGYAMVIFLAALQDVPRSLLEAAALDGASKTRTFAFVVWPELRPSALFVGVTSLLLSFQAFDVVRVMTQGGPVRSTTVLVYAIYEEVFVNLRVGRASALAMVFFALLLGVTVLQLRFFRRGLSGAA
jgi:ABC-type sugar transport system permease subunit